MIKTTKCPHCTGEVEVETFRNPTPTVDIIIEIDNKVVLIERKNEPFGWALPGGFVDYGESYEDAAFREAEEETGLVLEWVEQFRTYSNPERDPRQHTASTIFYSSTTGTPTGGDDAAQAVLFAWDKLPELAFDHGQILIDFLELKTKIEVSAG